MTRPLRYGRTEYGGSELLEVEGRELLQDASRKVRIEALTRFPVLVKALIEQVDAGLKAIDDAEKFVN